MRHILMIWAIVAVGWLAGCGESAGMRAATGGVGGAVVAGPAGAVVGGTLGAATAD